MKNKFLKFLITVVLLLIGIDNGIYAQTKDDTVKNIEATFPVIDEMFSSYAKQNHFPGVVYGLVLNGKLIHTGNLGYLNTSQKNKADSKSQFRIASMTKSFTAMAIVQLRDEGKLKLDDPVSLYIPEMAAQKYLTTDASPITIRHLLTHAAGFPEDNPWGDRQMAKSDEEFIAMIKKGISFSNAPGLTFEYSNMGYAMLGYIIKKVSGQSYQTYITENILKPLGMLHTYFEYSKVPPNELAHGYRWFNEKWVEQPMLHDGTYGAMGGMITSIEDFSKYTALHLTAWPPRNDPDNGPVKRSSVREMQFPSNIGSFNPQNTYPYNRLCPTVTAYCYGLVWTKYCNNIVYIGHGGGLPGFGSNWKIMPDYGIGIISFSNLTYADMNLINLKVLDTVIALAKLKPRQLPVSAILNQRKNELVSLLPEWKNPEAKPIFAENFFMDYFPDSLRKEATALFNKAGKISKTGELIPENNLRGSFILEGENNDIEISFTLTPENPPLIQEYNIKEIKKTKK
ncbi:beta-lactamase [Flavobacterium limnosediminis JC2902]|uniref:Beta-lactamase n=1 Tax=Flavobacterium limnosediminis JC2902 TaxID=1341181 RepID=V6SRT2_9FLAO|nr:serine hydrolase domain-containing protein [Flavobacterium limnosediminis]ESU27130.1 beta-lactamase [Flavobacterium limnosediminis JC2902]